MDELIRKILSLPPITLSRLEWRIATSIVQALDFITPSAFQNELKKLLWQHPELSFDKNHLEKFYKYLTAWHEVGCILMTWLEQLNAVWFNTNKERLSGDDLLPTIIDLIQTDKKTLTLLAHKLEAALILDATSHRAYIITAFHSAILYKLQPLSKSDNSPSDNDRILLEKVDKIREYLPTASEEVTRQKQIRQLAIHCGEYKAYLINMIKEKLKFENEELYNKYFSENIRLLNSNDQIQHEDTSIFDLIEENYKADTPLIKGNDLIVLLEKFPAIFDLHHTCIRFDVHSIHKLDEFGEKYRLYQDTLEKNSDEFSIKLLKALSGYVILEKIYTWLPESIRGRTTAERFKITTELFSEKNRFFSNRNKNSGDVLTTSSSARFISKA